MWCKFYAYLPTSKLKLQYILVHKQIILQQVEYFFQQQLTCTSCGGQNPGVCVNADKPALKRHYLKIAACLACLAWFAELQQSKFHHQFYWHDYSMLSPDVFMSLDILSSKPRSSCRTLSENCSMPGMSGVIHRTVPHFSSIATQHFAFLCRGLTIQKQTYICWIIHFSFPLLEWLGVILPQAASWALEGAAGDKSALLPLWGRVPYQYSWVYRYPRTLTFPVQKHDAYEPTVQIAQVTSCTLQLYSTSVWVS